MVSRQVADVPNITKFPVADTNFDNARVFPIRLVVLHTEVGFKKGTEITFGNPQSHVSAHYGVNQDGSIDQYVSEDLVAYQAGNYPINQYSIGIEHEDLDKPNDPRPDALYTTSAKLVANICQFYSIPIDRAHVVKHNEVNPQTGCPDGLDVDRIVREAAALIAPAAPAAPAVAPITQNQKDDANSVLVLHDAFTKLTTSDGKPFGSVEGMAREIVGAYPVYQSLTKPDDTGNPPVVLSHDQFLMLTKKAAANSEANSSNSSPTLPAATPQVVPANGNPMANVISNSNPQKSAPQLDFGVTWVLNKIAAAYRKLFMAPEG